MNVKIIIYIKKIAFEMLLYLASILDDSVFKCGEIINADAED